LKRRGSGLLSGRWRHKEDAVRPATLLAIALALGGCAGEAAREPEYAGAVGCVPLFQQYDVLESVYPDNQRRFDDRVAAPPVEAQAQRLRNAGCITMTADLAGMERYAGPPVRDGGAKIPGTSLHVGVVTSMEDDARARAFFESKGVPVRTIGSAALGRRVYVGPFGTEGALSSARSMAIAAGFAFPYVGQP
jgi:hypothetical protein